MLWHKAWLETQFKVWLSLATVVFFAMVLHSMPAKAANPAAAAAAFGFATFTLVVVICVWLAGAGINTQPAFQAVKGLHGSTLFTLSLPVSRARLIAVRAAAGWLEMSCLVAVWCGANWLAVPAVRTSVTAMQMFEYIIALFACTSTLYFLSVLLGVFLDDLWRMYGTMLAAIAFWLASRSLPLPASADIGRAVAGGTSPLIAHTMPWATMAFSVGLAVILFFAAVKIARTREY
ncbi:MAG TPA: hypothetical protein VIY49_32150 [Bryobacteraceae bacterium]